MFEQFNTQMSFLSKNAADALLKAQGIALEGFEKMLDLQFKTIENRWTFRDAPGGCDVEFHISYAFKSFVLQALVGGLFDKVFAKYTEAFEARAHQIYGKGVSA